MLSLSKHGRTGIVALALIAFLGIACQPVFASPVRIGVRILSGAGNSARHEKRAADVERRVIDVVNSIPGYRAVPIHAMCDDIEAGAEIANAKLYLDGALSMSGRTLDIGLYRVGNAHPIKEAKIAMMPNGAPDQLAVRNLFDKSRWSIVFKAYRGC